MAEKSTRRLGRFEGDATGINVEDRTPIDPRMPHLPSS